MRTTEKMERMMGRMTKRGQDLFQLPSHFFFVLFVLSFFSLPLWPVHPSTVGSKMNFLLFFCFSFLFLKKKKLCSVFYSTEASPVLSFTMSNTSLIPWTCLHWRSGGSLIAGASCIPFLKYQPTTPISKDNKKCLTICTSSYVESNEVKKTKIAVYIQVYRYLFFLWTVVSWNNDKPWCSDDLIIDKSSHIVFPLYFLFSLSLYSAQRLSPMSWHCFSYVFWTNGKHQLVVTSCKFCGGQYQGTTVILWTVNMGSGWGHAGIWHIDIWVYVDWSFIVMFYRHPWGLKFTFLIKTKHEKNKTSSCNFELGWLKDYLSEKIKSL